MLILRIPTVSAINYYVNFFIFALLLHVLGGCTRQTPQEILLFDALITREVVTEFWQPNNLLFSFNPNLTIENQNAEVKHFTIEYNFERKTLQEHFIVDIAVARSGYYLNPAEYQQHKGSGVQHNSTENTEYLHIGLRSKHEFFGAGPGGAAYGLSFTTSDNQFDVRISVSNLLPEGVTVPQFDMDGFAQHLSKRYDTIIKH